MIYLDTSVALAHLLSETRSPPAKLWDETLISSRLLEYEVWTRIHARRLADSHAESVRLLLGRIAFLGLVPPVLSRALEPFRPPVRTLDALHLASMDFLRRNGRDFALASFDDKLRAVARQLGVALFPL